MNAHDQQLGGTALSDTAWEEAIWEYMDEHDVDYSTAEQELTNGAYWASVESMGGR